jgi:hypothetical protein
MAAWHAAHKIRFLAQTIHRGQHLPGPGDDPFAFRSDPLENAIAFDDGDPEFTLSWRKTISGNLRRN